MVACGADMPKRSCTVIRYSKSRSANSRLADLVRPISSVQGDLRRALAMGPRHRKDITAQAHLFPQPILAIAGGDDLRVDDRNQAANRLKCFSLIFCALYAYLEEVIR